MANVNGIVIYGLHSSGDPDKQPFYIGLSNNPQSRLKQHVNAAINYHNQNPAKEAVIRGIIDDGDTVEMEIR